DNPLVFEHDQLGGDLVHGGNFFAQHTAFAADAVNAALTQMGVLAERQLDLLLNPGQNRQWPLLLSWQEGAMSGLAGLQITASAVVAEMRMQAQAYATSSIPTNAGNQDIVPMAANAARQAYLQTERLAWLVGALHLGFAQLNALKKAGKAKGSW
ncbi:aromatic amino acid lyase, partial [Arthrospira platensis SPKY1]|nr:aromatic amino acid lyase [Arthrospira platensis SPKY1]